MDLTYYEEEKIILLKRQMRVIFAMILFLKISNANNAVYMLTYMFQPFLFY